MGFFVLIIISSGTSVRAQNEKKIVRSIIITNGDTIINGQKLSEAKKEDRARLRKEMKEMGHDLNGFSEKSVIIKQGNGKEPLVLNWDDEAESEIDLKNGKNADVQIFKFDGKDMDLDSLLNGFDFKINGLDSNLRDRIITMHRSIRPGDPNMGRRMIPNRPGLGAPMPPEEVRKNSSSFNYNHVDQDGIISRMNIRISDIEKEKVDQITGSKGAITDLKVEDLTLFPNFSNGKMGLSFNISTNLPIKVKILNNEFKEVYSNDASNLNGSYSKQISLPKNGVYYIAIKQNNSWFLRKLIKS